MMMLKSLLRAGINSCGHFSRRLSGVTGYEFRSKHQFLRSYSRTINTVSATPLLFWEEAANNIDWIKHPEVTLDDSKSPLNKW